MSNVFCVEEMDICSEELKRLLAEQIKGICIVRRTVFEKRVNVISYYRGETRSLEYASTRVVNSRYD